MRGKVLDVVINNTCDTCHKCIVFHQSVKDDLLLYTSDLTDVSLCFLIGMFVRIAINIS